MSSLAFTKILIPFALFPLQVFSYNYPSWWVLYNACAWPSLDAAVPLACSTDTGLTATQCLCTSSDFLTNAAKGVGSMCGCSVLDQTASTAAAICEEFGFAIALSPSQMVAAGQACNNNNNNAGTSSSASSIPNKPTSTLTSSIGTNTPSETLSNTADTIASMTATPTVVSTAASTPTASSSSGGGGSNKWSADLAAGLSVGSFIVAALGLWFKFYKHRSKNKKNRSQADNWDAYTPLASRTRNAFQTDLRRIV